MIVLIKRHSTLIFIILSANLFLLRMKLGFDRSLSIAAILCLLVGKAYVDGHGSDASLIQRICGKASETLESFKSLLGLERDVHLALFGRYPAPSAPTSQADTFAFARTNEYSMVIGLIFIGALADIPLTHVLIHHFVPDAYRLPAHGAALFLTLYGLIWIISDYRAIRSTMHELTVSDFSIRLGWRVIGVVPIKSVRSVSKAPDSVRQWRISQGLRRDEVGLITPLDAPNVLIEIEPGICFTVMSIKRCTARYLAIYVDDPIRLIGNLRQKIQPPCNSDGGMSA